ncbi:ABC transporter permease [Frateuria aurantia]
MHFRHIFNTLLRHRMKAGLLVLEIAFSCAVVCNAIFLISTRLERMHRPTGMDEIHLIEVGVRSVVPGSPDALIAQTRTDINALQGIPGVVSVALLNQPVFGNEFSMSRVSLSDDSKAPSIPVSQYLGPSQLASTLGLKLAAGRWFNRDEMVSFAQLQSGQSGVPVIISKALAQRLFPGGAAVGKTLYVFGEDRVVGVAQRLVQPTDYGPAAQYEDAMLFPVELPYSRGSYLIRVREASQRQRVIQQALQTLKAAGPPRLISGKYATTLEDARGRYYRDDRAMAWMLVAVCILLLAITAVGIVGLTSFWVAQRRRQIGIRRAIGATRSDILRYFQTENFLIASVGIGIGMGLTYGLNQLLMSYYEVGRLPGYYLPLGALALWSVAQLSVLGPAVRASWVSPIEATRSE